MTDLREVFNDLIRFEIEIWNAFLTKRCWRDRYTPRLHSRLQEAGLPLDSVLTMFDCIDLEEGRPLA